MSSVRGPILYVDDDENLLSGVKRRLHGFDLRTEVDPRKALELLREDKSLSVIVSDLRMPGIDGFALLRSAQDIVPDATRILLTGHADLDTAKRAVNEGSVFRFLTKPCASEELGAALRAGIEFHDLKVAQRVLLERTLRGAVQVLADVLGLVNPAAFGRASRVTRYVQAVVARLELPDAWRYEVAAMLSQVGCVTVPPAIVEKVNTGKDLDLDERRMLGEHPRVAQQLLAGIPRLEEVAEMIRHQNERVRSPAAAPSTGTDAASAAKDVPLGSRILKVALDMDEHEARGCTRAAALQRLLAHRDWYDADVLEALVKVVESAAEEFADVEIAQLAVGMIVAQDIRTGDGLLLVSAGQTATVGMVERLQNWARRGDRSIPQRIRVSRPGPLEAGARGADA
jgi:response regulator RpfG family c-di-GMP phosphodiesterase